ncbi:MAG: TIGR03905 family TSCPD domain-containing protein [Bacilli bacterium]|nr:TIGR03905 family TSCPD domain-containing protein [Bacilli bacterium]
MQYIYKPTGVCSSQMTFEIEGDKLSDICIEGGCSGNSKGICALIKGDNIDTIIHKLSGIPCRNRKTSCPDQIALALKLYKEKRNM